MAFGPMQVLVLGFDEPNFTGEVLEELRRLRQQEIVRVVDVIVVAKDEDGEVSAVEGSGLDADEATELGAIAGALIGLGAAGEEGAEAGALLGAEAAADGVSPLADDMWAIADVIAPGTTAAVAIIEHQWAIPLRDAIRRAGGQGIAAEWLHPEDLVAIGAVAAAEAEAEPDA